jgi:hypothetical protein
MVATRKHAKGSPVLPHTQRIYIPQTQTGDIVIGTGPGWTSLITLPEFVVQHSPVMLLATVRLNIVPNGGAISFRVTRDGVALTQYDDEFSNVVLSMAVRTYHWFDETPGANPVYILQALATLANNESRDATIFSAHF